MPILSESIKALAASSIASYRSGDLARGRQLAQMVLDRGAGPREQAAAHHVLGMIARDADSLDVAAQHFASALSLQPAVVELRKELFEALKASARHRIKNSQFADAESIVRRAIDLNRDHPDAKNILGVALHRQGKHDAAKSCFEDAIATSPNHPQLRLNFGNLLAEQRQIDLAIEHYKRAVELRPHHVGTLLSAGGSLVDAKRYVPAVDLLQRAVRLDASNADAHFNLANALVALHENARAVTHYEHALQLRPAWSRARANWMRQRAEICDWRDDWNQQIETLVSELQAEPATDHPSLRVSQAPALPIPAGLMHRLARRETVQWLRDARSREIAIDRRPRSTRDRLRIGYLSCDFRDHATGHLVRTMFAHHDRREFEVFAYSYGINDASEYRNRIEADAEHFVDLYPADDETIGRRIAADQIDILVDMMGYAGNGRPGVLALRPAALLVHYLGFPSTLGGLVDYFVTDSVITPCDSDLRAEFHESLIYLPHTYQMTDDQQWFDDCPLTRAQCGLPDSGFVFAAFNNQYKVQPEVFDVWMKILLAVPGSVLWIVVSDPTVVANLRAEANKRGVDSARLVFADVASKPKHLARHRLADLFLDTTVCCAHTTATDSLWSGIPVLTCPGTRFTERVAASLVTSAGMKELVVNDLQEYERLAIELAKHPERCVAIREKWEEQRHESPLFQTANRVKELEHAYQKIWQRHKDGLTPADVTVVANP